MKKPLQFFSIGLLTATVIISIFYTALPENSSEAAKAITDEEIIAKLEANNYQVLTDQELFELEARVSEVEKVELLKENKEQKEKIKEDEKNENKEKEITKNKEPSTYKLVIREGTSPTEVYQTLEDKGFINNAESFNTYMNDRNLTEYVQIGEFEIVKGMNRDEIADTITRQ
ncbi:endolytic transglycosylase MltG [Halobacillus massiliensis]|uniref:endolytic transglycosylase MltG n=1 Tax=Halobacillus massiliensis TaxID=1926286 RepID=UPI0009E4974C|nr:endolytic transglycosylase MltG [Halobacillus massiliensis]